MPERALDQYQGSARATWFLPRGWGTHTLEAGLEAEHAIYSRTSSSVLGGFVQDSWALNNYFTVNGGVRYDVQWLGTEAEGSAGIALFSPRVGLAVDPSASGRAKLFIHYGKYPGLVPLGLLDRANVDGSVPVPAPTVIDPELRPLSSTEAVAGVAYEAFYMTRVAATYTHRELDSGLASLRGASSDSVVLVNPGSGYGSALPKAERTQDAVTLEVNREFAGGWLAHLSYTWLRLRGNTAVPWGATLPLDRPHTFKAHGAREFHFGNSLSASLGLAWFGSSGAPVEGQAARTPWVHTVDARLGAHWRLDKEQVVSFNLDAFNVLNFQAATRLAPVRYQPPRQVRLGVRYSF